MNRGLTFGTVIVLVCLLLAPGQSNALTVDQYCALTVDWMTMLADSWNAKISLLYRYADAVDLFLAEELELSSQLMQGQEALFESYETGLHEYFGFSESCADAIQEYLVENPEIGQQMSDMMSENVSLIDEYENLLTRYGVRGE
ncbi:MAG: hypothetical protein V1694_02225 [Candidatus Eisenbacteria bacterium]